MAGSWNPTNHTISDFNDWNNDKKLVIQPDFQRKAVWNNASKVMLIDTILKKYPIPKIFIQNSNEENGKTVRKIIDGQQRITAIIEFINNKFNLDSPYNGEYKKLLFKDLPQEIRDNVMRYVIDCNEAYGYTEEQYREIYTRLNKYTVPLNSQELRKAEFPGSFYQLSEEIAANETLDSWKIFTIASRRRLLDVEFVSEILCSLVDGPQDKKSTLDDYYKKYNDEDLSSLRDRLLKIINEISLIFPDGSISKTRFKQKSDFYSLVVAIDHFVQQGLTLVGKNLHFLQKDFYYLDREIDPSEDCFHRVLQEYAIRCVSSANTYASRKWRADFLILVLSGTYLDLESFNGYIEKYRYDKALRGYLEIFDSIDPVYNDSGMCPLGFDTCINCNDEIDFDRQEYVVVWRATDTFQRSSLYYVHRDCFDEKRHFEYKINKDVYYNDMNDIEEIIKEFEK